jgi:hypothetical protein
MCCGRLLLAESITLGRRWLGSHVLQVRRHEAIQKRHDEVNTAEIVQTRRILESLPRLADALRSIFVYEQVRPPYPRSSTPCEAELHCYTGLDTAG